MKIQISFIQAWKFKFSSYRHENSDFPRTYGLRFSKLIGFEHINFVLLWLWTDKSSPYSIVDASNYDKIRNFFECGSTGRYLYGSSILTAVSPRSRKFYHFKRFSEFLPNKIFSSRLIHALLLCRNERQSEKFLIIFSCQGNLCFCHKNNRCSCAKTLGIRCCLPRDLDWSHWVQSRRPTSIVPDRLARRAALAASATQPSDPMKNFTLLRIIFNKSRQ